ncbi:hypothetical protein B0A48_12238 [Cryoendolithus antarcticus]|uniref:t-SNARE coiled-coil homology domain-containing protein n=1 Tax=Cryoendolithus antarcticus TaxID=1507870 RepID=A0A1V8SUG4_9PEZI|nr:hypothetical protein B0A48_12238 [Cryoendolithus antarcticus]
MTDLRPALNDLLTSRSAAPIIHQPYDLTRINAFLQDAYNLHARIADLTRTLRQIRPSYLSTAAPARRRIAGSNHDRSQPLTNQERENFDAESKALLRQLNAAIAKIRQAEDARRKTVDVVALSKRAKGGLGALGRWAAGGAVTAKSLDEELEEAREKSIAGFREGVILFLQERLRDAGGLQSEMMEIRLGREVERSKSVLYKSRGGVGGVPYVEEDEPSGMNGYGARSGANHARQQSKGGRSANGISNAETEELTQDQLQVFASENADLLKHYEDQLDQIAQAERSILDISELHSQLHANLEVQSEHIQQLIEDSYLTSENLGKGNQELKRASERRSTAAAVFWGTVGFCSFLVVWDLVF